MTQYLPLITLSSSMSNSITYHRQSSLNTMPSALKRSGILGTAQFLKKLFMVELFATAIALGGAELARAELQPPSTAPDELTQILSEIDAAASDQDLEGVMEYISPQFTHTDGLDYEGLQTALQDFWERVGTVDYSTELTGWEGDGNDWIAETRTTVTGFMPVGERSGTLESVIESRQEFSDGLLVEQTVTSEQSQMTLGNDPPTLDINLPQHVGVGQSFSFDAIVLEPLGDRILLGSAFEEEVTPEGYTTSAVVDLDLLSAGGLFKIGRAPAELGDRWVSAIIVREDGITTITRRLQVVSPDEVPQEFQTQ